MVNLLARGKGVEVHALGLVDSRGDGHLFVGQSGAGKSTMARLWAHEPGIDILSDDRIILRKSGKQVWIYGTPWHGDAMLSSPGKAPLKKIYFLQHGGKNEISPLNPADSVSRLFSCSFLPFHHPHALNFSLAFLEEVVKATPSYELDFLPDKSIVHLLKK